MHLRDYAYLTRSVYSIFIYALPKCFYRFFPSHNICAEVEYRFLGVTPDTVIPLSDILDAHFSFKTARLSEARSKVKRGGGKASDVYAHTSEDFLKLLNIKLDKNDDMGDYLSPTVFVFSTFRATTFLY